MQDNRLCDEQQCVHDSDSIVVPHVSIEATPALSVGRGQPVTLHAIVTNAGPTPAYQWKINGHNIAGATLDSYTSSSYHDYDSDNLHCSKQRHM